MQTVKSGLIVTALGLALSLALSTAPPALADAPPVDCNGGCIKCQQTCKGPDCVRFCVAQWAGCCVTAGKKPTPGMATCGCQ